MTTNRRTPPPEFYVRVLYGADAYRELRDNMLRLGAEQQNASKTREVLDQIIMAHEETGRGLRELRAMLLPDDAQ